MFQSSDVSPYNFFPQFLKRRSHLPRMFKHAKSVIVFDPHAKVLFPKLVETRLNLHTLLPQIRLPHSQPFHLSKLSLMRVASAF